MDFLPSEPYVLPPIPAALSVPPGELVMLDASQGPVDISDVLDVHIYNANISRDSSERLMLLQAWYMEMRAEQIGISSMSYEDLREVNGTGVYLEIETSDTPNFVYIEYRTPVADIDM